MRERVREALRRIASMINRVVLNRVDNDHKNQKWLVRGVEEQDKEIEVFELYGLTTQPRVDETAEVLRFSLEGFEDHTVTMGATGGSDRPRDGLPGEVILYTYWDEQDDEHSKHRIILAKEGNEIRVHVGETVLNVTRTGVEITGNLKVSGNVDIARDVNIGGDVNIARDVNIEGALGVDGKVDIDGYKKDGTTVI